MTKLVITLLSLLILVGCKDEISGPTLVTISMIESNDADLFKNTVILYEDDEYLISTYFEKYISSYPFDVLFGYEELKQKAIQDTLTLDTLLMRDYIRYNGDDTYTLAHHLEKGSCLIYDKKSNQIIKTIQMEEYSYGGPMSTTTGRRFYIKKRLLFLETVDTIS